MKKRIILMAFALLAGIAGAQPVVNDRAPAFTLQDQYEKTFSLRQYEGSIVILIGSDKEGNAQNPAWKKAIRNNYADRVAIQGIADVSSVPFFLKGKIRNDFKKEYEENILLDWKGEVVRSYAFAKGVSNIVLIDTGGMIRHRTSGTATPDAVRELFKKIDSSLSSFPR